MIPIRNCPFCGGPAELRMNGDNLTPSGGFVFVKCVSCGAQGRILFDKYGFARDGDEWADTPKAKDAIAAWNRRFHEECEEE